MDVQAQWRVLRVVDRCCWQQGWLRRGREPTSLPWPHSAQATWDVTSGLFLCLPMASGVLLEGVLWPRKHR